MKKQVYLVLIFFVSCRLSAQIVDCPTKDQRDYSCGNVHENVMNGINREGYEIKSHFNIYLKKPFARQNDNDIAVKVIALCNQVLNDPDFWNALEHYSNYKYAVFESANGKQQIAGIQIVNCLINGSPDDNVRPLMVDIPLEVELYGPFIKTFFESAVAKEVGDGKIYNKRWFFRGASYQDIGSNWIHEFAHIKGLKHCYYCSIERDFSIPYVINRIFSEVAKKYSIHG